VGEKSPTTLREKEMSKSYKILVPKPASSNKDGTDVKLYQADEIVDAKESWQDDVMQTFVENGWAMEVKVEASAEESSEPIKRARNEDGTLKGDDPSTPDVNEAWEGGEAPKKTTRKKRTTKKKS
tara:strand:+ start:1346 stop:1720 length:375 start_codon:yes stop_codon:yes gene_type:complete